MIRPNESVPYADPLHAGRHPFQTYMLTLCVVSGLPMLFGEPTAQSIEALLPGWMAIAWGLSLCFGSIIALVGSYFPKDHYATALTLERAGLCIVGPAALVYAAAIMLYSGDNKGVVAAAITFGFGIACLKRASDIGKVFVRAIASLGSEPMERPDREFE